MSWVSSYPQRFRVAALKHFVVVLEPADELVGHELSLCGVGDVVEGDGDDHAVIWFKGVPHCSGKM